MPLPSSINDRVNISLPLKHALKHVKDFRYYVECARFRCWGIPVFHIRFECGKIASIPFCSLPGCVSLLLYHTIGEHPILGSTDFEICLVPAALEGHARVQDGQRNEGEKDHHAFEDHEANFLVCEFTIKASFELGDTVAGSDEDEERCREKH